MRTWRHSSEALIALSRQLRLGTGPAAATQTARLLGTNRGFAPSANSKSMANRPKHEGRLSVIAKSSGASVENCRSVVLQ
jgi:hypothetical protein